MSRLRACFGVQFPAFHLNVEMDVPMSGITAIFGPSGSGKTTLLRCLAGLERAPQGFLQVGDEVWQDEKVGLCRPLSQRPIGYVFQEPRLFPHYNVRANLLYGYKRVPSEERRIAMEQVGAHRIGAVLDAPVAAHEAEYGLTRLECHGQSLFVPPQAVAVGQVMRVHILSSDVSVVIGRTGCPTSVLNVLEATIIEIREMDQASVDVRLDIRAPLVASITRKSLITLGLKPGQRVFAHIKVVALNEELKACSTGDWAKKPQAPRMSVGEISSSAE